MSAIGASQPELSRTEARLVEAARGGDERAFGELYERYGRRIFAYVLSIVRDHGRAEDIVQDVFVSALRRMRSSDRAISFKPWIYEIAKNACIDELRRVQRAREVSIEQGSGEQLASADPSPDTSFERGQQLAILNGAFRGLSERQHKVMVLRELEGLSYAEIAAKTGMTVPMVESTLLRARRRLSQEYDEIATGRRCQQVHAVVDTGAQAAVDALGLRERRRFARHVAHCQPCARYVHLAGVSAPETGMPAVAKKIAGLLPFPIARWSLPWGRRSGSGSRASGLLRSARRTAQFAHPGASVGATPVTVATMAAVVIAGGGAAVGLLEPGHATATQRGPATISARTTAVTRAVRGLLRAGQAGSRAGRIGLTHIARVGGRHPLEHRTDWTGPPWRREHFSRGTHHYFGRHPRDLDAAVGPGHAKHVPLDALGPPSGHHAHSACRARGEASPSHRHESGAEGGQEAAGAEIAGSENCRFRNCQEGSVCRASR